MTLTPTGFPAQATQALLTDLLRGLKTRADIARVEAVTGRRADAPLALAGQISELVAVESRLAGLESYAQTLTLAQTRADVAQRSLSTLKDVVEDVTSQTTIALQNGSENGLVTVSEVADRALVTVVAALNVTVGGRALFGGNAGATTPLAPADEIRAGIDAIVAAAPDAASALADVSDAFNAPSDLFEASLYRGGTGDAPEVEVAPGERVAYLGRADEQPIRDLVRALGLLATAFERGSPAAPLERTEIAESALSDLRGVVDRLNRMSARIGSGEARLAAVQTENVALESILTQRSNDLAGSDPLEAATRLDAVEGQLQTLFLTTARLSNLSLASFLR